MDSELPEYRRNQLPAFTSSAQVQSKHSINKLKNSINWMLLFADKKTVYSKKCYIDKKGVPRHKFSFRLAFLTVTLTSDQKHSDKYIKEHMLQPLLYWLSRYFKASYVWKAETQLNGNLHFHITIDTFVPWRSVRAKWNQICAKHGYCKIMQDGSNDKGDAAIKINAICNENDLAKTIGGYLTKGSIEEKNHYAIKKKQFSLQEVIEKYPYITCNIETRKHYSRFVDGRIWGCSESLSKINVTTDETTHSELFNDTEHAFFHDNKVKNLAMILKGEAKAKRVKMDEQTISMLRLDDDSLNDKFSPFENVFVHRHLKFCKIPPYLAEKIAEEKQKRKFCTQRYFTVDSLL